MKQLAEHLQAFKGTKAVHVNIHVGQEPVHEEFPIGLTKVQRLPKLPTQCGAQGGGSIRVKVPVQQGWFVAEPTVVEIEKRTVVQAKGRLSENASASWM